MVFKYPISDCHIHVFDPFDITPAIEMVEYCGFTNWVHLAWCAVLHNPRWITSNLVGALCKLRENGRCQAFASFHYTKDNRLPDADELLRQIQWIDAAGFDGVKMLDGKPGVRKALGTPLDHPNYDKMFDYAARRQIPIMYHINDPVEFWHEDQLPQWAVKSGNFYGDGTYPGKYEIEEETFRFLRKHPHLKICIPHFFFISDQHGLCCEMLDRYPNLYLDITPGWEMYENFAGDVPLWRKFFTNHAHKILFGSDTYSDHWQETIHSMRCALETTDEFTAFEEHVIGLDLPEETLRQIYFTNYYKFVGGTRKKLNVPMVLEYADTLKAMADGPDKAEIWKTIDQLKDQIAEYKSLSTI